MKQFDYIEQIIFPSEDKKLKGRPDNFRINVEGLT